jgi:Calcineurin-like phosphoesterase
VLLAQLSDTHLTTGVLAAAPAVRAHQALARVQALRPRPDCLVITGDLADHGQAAEYEAALALLERLDLPVHVDPATTTTPRGCSRPWPAPATPGRRRRSRGAATTGSTTRGCGCCAATPACPDATTGSWAPPS